MNKLLGLGVAAFIVGKHLLTMLALRLSQQYPRVSLRPAGDRTRGDVPGWVLITLMSAVLVAGLLAIAGPALERLFNQAMDQVQP